MINVCIYLSLFTFFEACFSQLVFLFWWQHHLIFLSIPQDCFRLPPNKFLDGLVASASQSRHVSTLRPSIDRDWQRFVQNRPHGSSKTTQCQNFIKQIYTFSDSDILISQGRRGSKLFWCEVLYLAVRLTLFS